MNGFGKRLKELRGQYTITQKDLAESLGVTKGTVAKWEQGVRYPELGMMEKLAKAFNVPLSTLVDEEERKKPAELFAKRIRELRKQKRMTQDDLADALGISKFTVCGWERGLRCPEYSTVAALADFFGVPERYFFSDISAPADIEDYLTKKVAGYLKEQFATTDFVGDYIISISIRKMEEAGSRTEIVGKEEQRGGAGDAEDRN